VSNPRRSGAAAKFLGVSKSFLDKDRAKGGRHQVPFRRAGRAVIYDEPDLEEFKRANRVDPREQRNTTNT
jgi:hypothetical protein